METELLITTDGSHTLYLAEIDESYHSTHGAIQESKHIFIDAALKKCTKKTIHILEIGFGTGLNTFLTAIEADKTEVDIFYTTLEKFPVQIETALLLNYPAILSNNTIFEKLHKAQWEKEIEICKRFWLKKIKCDFTDVSFEKKYDLVFFDAFSPEKQPEMWTENQFQKIYNACNEGAILTTYCAKGSVRRALQAVGFKVERLPGPAGKREILRASK
ncbi:MAG: tRNA (5-methylaminomethyl-2-thiouridine)(34)-methyltransferase MnmD [Paludibacter sp.]